MAEEQQKAPLPDQEDKPDADKPDFDEAEQGSVYGLSDTDIQNIEEALHRFDEDAVEVAIAELSPAEAADLIEKISEEDRQHLIEEHAEELSADVFAELAPDLRKAMIEAMSAEDVAAMISDMDSDDALDLVLNLEAEFQTEIMHKLSGKMRLTLKEGLNFPEDSAGRLMQREFVAIPQFWTVGKTIDYLRAAADDLPVDFFDIFVISPTYHVVGEIPLSRVIRSRRSEKMENLSLEEPHIIPAEMDQEEVARLFHDENLISAPVVDNENRLIGVITVDDVVEVIHEEAQEDILRLAGVEKGDLYRAVLSTTSSRFRWLFINLLTAILASIVISLFDATIEQVVALAILMPIVASMGGNAGTQALTVAVRALATNELSRANAMRVIWKEMLVGTLNGVVFALIMGMIAAMWFGSNMLGIVIASAMVINLVVAGLCGAAIPVALQSMGSDPAVSSTVVLTTVTDVVGFLAFLGLAALFLI